jgi:multicomponent Na+:H+ antiporter subunit E
MKHVSVLFIWCFHLLEFLAFYVFEVIASNIKVAADVLTPPHLMTPELLEISVEGLSDRQLLVLSNLITMTPGTLCLGLTEAGLLRIHAMYAKDAEKEAQDLVDNYVRRVRRVF